MLEGQDEGGVFLRAHQVPDHEGEYRDHRLVGKARFCVEFYEGEESYFARGWLEGVVISISDCY